MHLILETLLTKSKLTLIVVTQCGLLAFHTEVDVAGGEFMFAEAFLVWLDADGLADYAVEGLTVQADASYECLVAAVGAEGRDGLWEDGEKVVFGASLIVIEDALHVGGLGEAFIAGFAHPKHALETLIHRLFVCCRR